MSPDVVTDTARGTSAVIIKNDRLLMDYFIIIIIMPVDFWITLHFRTAIEVPQILPVTIL